MYWSVVVETADEYLVFLPGVLGDVTQELQPRKGGLIHSTNSYSLSFSTTRSSGTIDYCACDAKQHKI